MKGKLWPLILAAAVILPRLESPGTELGTMEPVAVVQIIKDAGRTVIRTDTGNLGTGTDLPAAVADLQEKSPKTVELDTAENLLFWGNPGKDWDTVEQMFRPACGICVAGPKTDLAAAQQYLKTHSPEQTLGQYRMEGSIRFRLEMKGERGHFESVEDDRPTENGMVDDGHAGTACPGVRDRLGGHGTGGGGDSPAFGGGAAAVSGGKQAAALCGMGKYCTGGRTSFVRGRTLLAGRKK